VTILRWLGAAALVSSVGCTGNVASVADAGASGSDGSSAEDATSSSDASPGDAGSADAANVACVAGSLTFLVTAAPGAATGYCLGAPNSCSGDWLTVRPASGAALGLSDSCQTPCGSCEPVDCPEVCLVPVRLGDAGRQTAWDGTYYPSGTCGRGNVCVGQACASPGDYVATFCGYAALPDASVFQCEGVSTPTCVDTPFVWPPPAGGLTVQGVLGASVADGG
jgi:hypothetical protein